MNEVNKTLFIPLYGKSQVSKQGIILNDPMAEKIWPALALRSKGSTFSKLLSRKFSLQHGTSRQKITSKSPTPSPTDTTTS